MVVAGGEREEFSCSEKGQAGMMSSLSVSISWSGLYWLKSITAWRGGAKGEGHKCKIHTHACTHIHTHTHEKYRYTHTQTYVHMQNAHAHTHTYAHTYIHILVLGKSFLHKASRFEGTFDKTLKC